MYRNIYVYIRNICIHMNILEMCVMYMGMCVSNIKPKIPGMLPFKMRLFLKWVDLKGRTK